jgi:hypothetical protein
MALHEFYLEQFGPVHTDLDEGIVERLRSLYRADISDTEVVEFFEREGVVSDQDRSFYLIASEGDPDTFCHFGNNWKTLYSVLAAVWKTGDWKMSLGDFAAAAATAKASG